MTATLKEHKLWEVSQSKFKSFDGTELFYRSWKPMEESKKAIIFMHRGHEHSGRVEMLVNELGFSDHWAFAYDARGHGHSPGDRGYAEDFSFLIKDLNEFAKLISSKYEIPIENVAIVANSVGAVVASAWVHDYAPKIKGMVLAAPAFRIKLYVPLALPSLRVLDKVKKKAFIKSYVKSTMLTHDKEQAKAYDDDELIAKSIAVNILIGLHDTSSRLIDDAEAINTPILILSAGADWVVKSSAQKKFYDRLGSSDKEFHAFKGFHHGLFYEKDRQEVVEKSREFLNKCFLSSPDTSFLQDADSSGYTKNEFESLKKPPAFLKGLNFESQVMSMKTLGRLSKGIRLGLETGFDSGKTLDYVYQNKSTGHTPIGKMIDRIYLNAIGWKGIRLRKKNIESFITELIQKNDSDEVSVIDIATGGGRYILEPASQIKDKKVQLHLRDYQQQNLDKAKALATELNVENVSYELADILDEKSYQGQYGIAITSGIYELFPDNKKVLKSLRSLHNIVEEGGFLVYTGQPWHPQIEMIARTLTNREGQPWIMRRRTQAELDELVHSAGFKKVDMKIDPYGIFTVSIAQKIKA